MSNWPRGRRDWGPFWNNPQQVSDVTQVVHDHIASVYAENRTNCNANLTTNIFASDRFNCDVLAHADLSRTKGESLGPRLDRINWGLRPRRDRRVPQLPQRRNSTNWNSRGNPWRDCA